MPIDLAEAQGVESRAIGVFNDPAKCSIGRPYQADGSSITIRDRPGADLKGVLGKSETGQTATEPSG